ncbi:MAG: hypothetical protein IT167_30730 [Bryobacterales bacterium]|nr:hypothetical protein [Bryobacterales bacterium]
MILTDDNGGSYTVNASSFSSGAENASYKILLPDFQTSNFGSFLANQINFSITATALTGDIHNLGYAILGAFVDDPGGLGPAVADYQINANAASASGTFPPPATAAGILYFASTPTLNITGQLNLNDNGGSAAVFEVDLNANTDIPEPSTAAFLLLGIAVLTGRWVWSRYPRAPAPTLVACLLLFTAGASAQSTKPKPSPNNQLSGMGRLARLSAQGTGSLQQGSQNVGSPGPAEDCDDCINDPDFTFPGGGFNSEVSVAIDATGMNIVVGFNDARGFALNPPRLSGFAYSHDGGITFTDGGQLPAGPTETFAGGTVPQLFGDPDVKWVPGGAGCQFVYSSIMLKRFPATGTITGTAQTMAVNVSTDCGVTWSNPIEVTAATNPNGGTSGSGCPSAYPCNAADAADKEFIDVDPDTGRILMAWSNFSTQREIRTSFSDNLFGASPSWSSGVIVSTSASGYYDQGAAPRFAGGGSNNAYLTFGRYSATLGTPYSGFSMNNIGFAVSADNGVTWGPVSNLRSSDYYPPDYILGNDRTHSFPGIAVDNSGGPNNGSIYIAYADNNSADGADVVFQRSTNGGISFSAPVTLSSRPGVDRPQWFPYVTVDKTTGRVSVFFFDQGVASSGDLTQLTWLYSDNGGVTWSSPTALCAPPIAGTGATNGCDRAFHAGYGNDTSQPNLGDYNGADARLGAFYAAFAGTRESIPYTDGQPSASMTTPEVRFKKLTAARASLDLGSVSIIDSGGNGLIDAGDMVRMTLPLRNSVTNAALAPPTYTSVSATLTTSTTGVTILRSTSSYPNIAPGATQNNSADFVFLLSPSFVPGARIEFILNITTAQSPTSIAFYKDTGTPVPSTLLSENFNGVSAGSLPAGWSPSHGGGTNTVPWTTNNTFCSTASNALFHVNANDAANPTRFERVFSPLIAVPASAGYVTLDFDVCYDTEDAPDFRYLAFDGFTLRITDQTAGRTLRSVLAEAFAGEFTTGGIQHFPKHLPRGSSPYFEDMSVWAGGSGAGPSGFQHVQMRLPGMQGSTVQLRWEYTQDSGGICTDARPGARTCGVMVDNILMRSVTLKSDELSKIVLAPTPGVPGAFTATVSSQAIAGAGGITVNLSSSNPAITTMPATVIIPAGSQAAPPFSVVINPAASGTTVTITATGPSNVRTGVIRIL